jgi:beta-lactamase class A
MRQGHAARKLIIARSGTFFSQNARSRGVNTTVHAAITRTAVALLTIGLAAASAYTAPQSSRTMTSDIAASVGALVRDFHGIMGIAVLDLSSGLSSGLSTEQRREVVGVNADSPFPTASTIKTAVMVEAYEQAAAGELSMDTVLTLRAADKVGGSGVLRDMHDGLGLTVRDAVQLMITLSDNTATNLLVDRLGVARIDARLDAYGLKRTRIFRATFRDGRPEVLPELEREFGLGMTTPREMALLLGRIAEGQAVTQAASSEMLATLRRQQDRAMIPRLLPEDAEVGNKTGTDSEKQAGPAGVKGQVRADAAIVTGPNGLRYVIAIYARQVEDQRWTIENDALTTGARVSRLVYDHLSRRPER